MTNTLTMPRHFVIIESDEMEYLDGGNQAVVNSTLGDIRTRLNTVISAAVAGQAAAVALGAAIGNIIGAIIGFAAG